MVVNKLAKKLFRDAVLRSVYTQSRQEEHGRMQAAQVSEVRRTV